MSNWKNKIKDFLFDNSQKLALKTARVDEDALALLILKQFFQQNSKNNCKKQLAVITPSLAESEKVFASLLFIY